MAEKKRKDSRDVKATKQDEYYTQFSDIEEELRHYREHFAEKIVYCNCDDPFESNFFLYFVRNFEYLGLKKLITTCYDGSPIAGTQFVPPFKARTADSHCVAYKIEITGVEDFSSAGRKLNFWDVEKVLLNGTEKVRIEKLKGDGDFRSPECVELLTHADIVCTNPPPSLFAKYVALLVENGKEFLILGDKDAITQKEIFPLIKRNEMWMGLTPMPSEEMFFFLKQDGATKGKLNGPRRVLGRMTAVWFTNLEHDKRHQPLILTKKYTPEEYPKYGKYDAIRVEMVRGIPYDYDGVMCVPVSFLEQYCPEQFEIVGITESKGSEVAQPPSESKKLFIRKK